MDADLLEVSLVENPVHKYAVAFMVDNVTGKQIDQYDYSLVAYVTDGLVDPYHGWTMEWSMRRQPHSRYGGVAGHEDCPCQSGKPYSECCLREDGVLQPHIQISFSVPPPPGLPAYAYASDYRASKPRIREPTQVPIKCR